MKTEDLVRKFVHLKRQTGLKYEVEEKILLKFSSKMNQSLASISENDVSAYFNEIQDADPKQRAYFSIRLFFRWCVDRKYLKKSPVYYLAPRYKPSDFVPYIYSVEEIKRILKQALSYDDKSSPLQGRTFYTLLLLVYACGLRLGEAIALRIEDVDFEHNLVLIRESKFRKSRQLPVCDDLISVLQKYLLARRKFLPCISGNASPFFATRTGHRFLGTQIAHLFERVRDDIGLKIPGRKIQPRIHDLRHSFAVHRLLECYKSGESIRQFLPALSTYLGHKDIEDTKTYLTLTRELKQLVSDKFEKSVWGE